MRSSHVVTCVCKNIVVELLAVIAFILLVPALYITVAAFAHMLLGIPVKTLLAINVLFWLVLIIVLLVVKDFIVVYKYACKAMEENMLPTTTRSAEVVLSVLIHSPIILTPLLIDDIALAFGAAFSKLFATLAVADITPGLYDVLTDFGKYLADVMEKELTIPLPGFTVKIALGILISLVLKVIVVACFLWNDIMWLLTSLGAATALIIACVRLREGFSEPQKDSARLAIATLCGEKIHRVHPDSIRYLVNMLVKLRSVVGKKAVAYALDRLAKWLKIHGFDTSVVENTKKDLERTIGIKWYVLTLLRLAIDFTILTFVLLA